MGLPVVELTGRCVGMDHPIIKISKKPGSGPGSAPIDAGFKKKLGAESPVLPGGRGSEQDIIPVTQDRMAWLKIREKGRPFRKGGQGGPDQAVLRPGIKEGRDPFGTPGNKEEIAPAGSGKDPGGGGIFVKAAVNRMVDPAPPEGFPPVVG
jgi:hypothetical protein